VHQRGSLNIFWELGAHAKFWENELRYDHRSYIGVHWSYIGVHRGYIDVCRGYNAVRMNFS
jgi:hypothetical protein